MSPRVRRAIHEAIDLVLDAVAEEARETTAKKTRTRPVKERVLPPSVSDITLARALAVGKKAGLL